MDLLGKNVDNKIVHPIALPKNIKQLNASQANISRRVTRVRNVIEREFGRLKHWKILKNTVDSNLIPKIHDITKLIMAIQN